MQQIKSIVDSLAHSELAQNVYDAVSHKWGTVGVAIALALAILIGSLAFGYDVADIQAWFERIAE